jgi:hypothetical protein
MSSAVKDIKGDSLQALEAPKYGDSFRVFFQVIGYYRVFAAGSSKKPVQAHNLHPSMPPLTAALPEEARS